MIIDQQKLILIVLKIIIGNPWVNSDIQKMLALFICILYCDKYGFRNVLELLVKCIVIMIISFMPIPFAPNKYKIIVYWYTNLILAFMS